MGQSASAAGRSYKAAEAASKAVRQGASHVPGPTGAAAIDAERAARQQASKRAALTVVEEEQLESRDQDLGILLDQLGVAIRGKVVDVQAKEPSLHGAQVSSIVGSAGRLPIQALKELFELHRQAAGGPVDATYLIQRYQADPDLIQHVLSHMCLPELVEAEGSDGVQAFAVYPDWFQRRGQ
eukprot:GHRR01011827.1.p1 GENE.GHRR01011827.1~~GHRR01011827.1.p1  ORF type:complete len:182 (+),score=60.62 GHRR01011827.1:709-1254(+)